MDVLEIETTYFLRAFASVAASQDESLSTIPWEASKELSSFLFSSLIVSKSLCDFFLNLYADEVCQVG